MKNQIPKKIKRIIDVIISLLCLIILSPLFVIIAILIKLDSKGSIFFRQKRIGENGKIFKIWKFRSMKTSCEKTSVKKIIKYEITGNDPRLTNAGRFLRKYHLDELPQLMNVLDGEMSIVGPRPFFLARIKENPELAKGRVLAKPGMTGISQIYIYKNKKINDKKIIELDLSYIKKWTIFLDIKIMFKTMTLLLTKVKKDIK